MSPWSLTVGDIRSLKGWLPSSNEARSLVALRPESRRHEIDLPERSRTLTSKVTKTTASVPKIQGTWAIILGTLQVQEVATRRSLRRTSQGLRLTASRQWPDHGPLFPSRHHDQPAEAGRPARGHQHTAILE